MKAPYHILTFILFTSSAGSLAATPWESLFPSQLLTKNDTTVDRDTTLGNKIVGIYFGARWCGPCQQFTPGLVNFRNNNSSEFEVVFASADTSKSEQLAYMREKKMTFPAVQCKTTAANKLYSAYGINGIPAMVILSPKDGSVISTNGRSEITNNPSGALQAWKDKAGIVDVDPPVLISFTGNSPVFPGEQVTLRWSQSGAAQLQLNPGGSIAVGTNSTVVTPTQTTTYVLTASNDGGSVSKSFEVVVSPPEITSFSGSSPIYNGEESTLLWSQTGATQLHLDPGGDIPAGSSSIKVSPTANTTYTLTATNASGSTAQTFEVLVFPPPPKEVWQQLDEVPSNTSDIFSFGSAWKYFQPVNGLDPVGEDEDFYSTWYLGVGYDGAGFSKSGKGLLGFGQIDYGSLSTYLPAPALGSRYTAYFKKTFSNPITTEAGFEIFCDDGAVVYLDGVEIARTANLPKADTFHSLATSEADEKVTLAFGSGTLRAGLRTLAVSVHNSNTHSYDLGFGMRLFSLVDPTGGNEKFGDWLRGKGLDALPVSEQSLDADPDKDGLPNLLEYALGGNPLSGGGSALNEASADPSKVSVTFVRVKASEDPKLSYQVQYCAELGTAWVDGAVMMEGAADGVDQAALPDGQDPAASKFERIRATFVQDPAIPLDQGFLRIQVSQE